MRIWIVDAFTDIPYKGNPAAVAIVKEFPNEGVCQKISAEIGLSETAFIKKLEGNRFHLRWYTPKVEAKLCGHATLASAHILHQEALISGNEISFDSLSGPLRVYLSESSYTLDFPLQKTGGKIELGSSFRGFVQAVKACDDVIVELASEEDVRNYVPSNDELEKIDCRGVILTSRGKNRYDFISRFFAPKVGINEDPVTGSAHCKLAHWGTKLNKREFLAYQASSRGGEIQISIHDDRVYLTGKAVTILEGQWKVSV